MKSQALRKKEVKGYVNKHLVAPLLQIDEKLRDELIDGMMMRTMISMYNIANSEVELEDDEEQEEVVEIDDNFDIDDLINSTINEQDDYGEEDYEGANKEINDEKEENSKYFKPADRINAANTMIRIAAVYDNRKRINGDKNPKQVIVPQDLQIK